MFRSDQRYQMTKRIVMAHLVKQYGMGCYDHKSFAWKCDNTYYFLCPHCKLLVQVPSHDLNCRIFRHGCYRTPGNPFIPPHLPKNECDRLKRENLIHGCGKPFQFTLVPQGVSFVKPCGYL